jgi:hypothetical protein
MKRDSRSNSVSGGWRGGSPGRILAGDPGIPAGTEGACRILLPSEPENDPFGGRGMPLCSISIRCRMKHCVHIQAYPHGVTPCAPGTACHDRVR